MKRIVVTGLGCISALGDNIRGFTDQLLKGNSGIAPTTLFDTETFQAKISAEVKGYNENDHFNDKQLAKIDRFAQFALLSAREAAKDAGLEFKGTDAERTAVIQGTGAGGQTTQDINYHRLYAENAKRLHPFTVPKLISSSAVSWISMDLGVRGPAFATTSACSSSGHAIAMSLMMLRSGMIDTAITGGSEASISYGTIRAWESLRILAKDTCRPFSLNRSGLVIGEGGGTLILETLEHAEARGAKIYAELAGCGMSSDAFDMLQPDEGGAARAIKGALDDARLSPEDVSYINAHGTGTPQNDPTESRAIRSVFGGHADSLAVSSTKSMHGHTLGAASALEAIATVISIQEQTALPTTNFIDPDPQCDLDYVPNIARPMKIDAALSNSFAFGGLNTVLAFRRYR